MAVEDELVAETSFPGAIPPIKYISFAGAPGAKLEVFYNCPQHSGANLNNDFIEKSPNSAGFKQLSFLSIFTFYLLTCHIFVWIKIAIFAFAWHGIYFIGMFEYNILAFFIHFVNRLL